VHIGFYVIIDVSGIPHAAKYDTMAVGYRWNQCLRKPVNYKHCSLTMSARLVPQIVALSASFERNGN
jgi:hypothetical protein